MLNKNLRLSGTALRIASGVLVIFLLALKVQAAGRHQQTPDPNQATKKGYLIGSSDRDIVVAHWTKTFRHGTPPPFVGEAAPGSAAEPSSSGVAEILNLIFQDVTVQATGDTYLITGPKERVRQVKVMLARWLDVPYPTVSLNVMSFQASTQNYRADKVADAVELASAGISITREFLRLYTIDFATYVQSLRAIRLDLPGNQDLEKVREIYSEYHLLDSSPFDSSDLSGLNGPPARIEPFVDDLAYLVLQKPQVFSTRESSLPEFMTTRGRALAFLNAVELQLINTHRKLNGLPRTNGFRSGEVRDPFEAEAANILSKDAESLQVSRDSAQRGLKTAARLIALCQELRANAYPALPLFNQMLSGMNGGTDLNSLLQFLYEYSLPNTYTEIDPKQNSRSNRLFSIAKRTAAISASIAASEQALRSLIPQLQASPGSSDLLGKKQAIESQIRIFTEDLEALRAERNSILANQWSGGAKRLTEPTRPVNPESLVMKSANVDEMLKNATETFSHDVQSGILTPLTNWVQSNNRGHKDGLVLTGNVSLSVTSSMGATVSGQSTFYAPYTPQQQLSAAELASLFAAPSSGQAALKALSSLTPPPPTYSTISPGLDLSVLPAVLPGGRAARLQIQFRTSEQVRDDPGRPVKTPSVNSHEIHTDLAIGAFDLFPLTTFNVETTTLGDPQWQIYGLEGIPLIGNIFVGPRRPATSVSRSLVIVYATILPRSLDLARRYSSDSN